MDRRIARAVGSACLAALVLAAAAAAPATSQAPQIVGTPTVPATAQAPLVLVVGDSLATGLQPFLPAMLPGSAVTFAVRRGWTTPAGMRAFRSVLRTAVPQTVVISLGTNDGPDPDRFRDRVRRTLLAAPASACIIWPAIYRPRRKGAYPALNRVLRSEARRDPRLVVIAWDRTVTKKVVRLPDGLHPDTNGYRWRSHIIAAAVGRGCRDPIAAPSR